MDESRFLDAEKSLLIAPAGYGKTHFISQAVRKLNSKQLILTHTHAGVASIKQKLGRNDVPRELYEVETISSFAQRFVEAYYTGGDTPAIDRKEHFPFVTEKATGLVSRDLIRQVIANSYNGLFVDEYQDCTEIQHSFVKKLADFLPTRLLGDHLQGIFNMNGAPLVDLQCPQQMAGFIENTQELDAVPWRWQNTGRGDLGQAIVQIRTSLESGEPVDLADFPAIDYVHGDENDVLDWQSNPGRQIRQLSGEQDLLLIHPRSESPHFRLRFNKTYLNRFYMLEAIDDKAFYSLSSKLDAAEPTTYLSIIEAVLDELVNRSELKNWIARGKIVKKKLEKLERWKIERYQTLTASVAAYERSPSVLTLRDVLTSCTKLPGVKCYRREILASLLSSMSDAAQSETTISDAMILNRNRLRRVGRQINGRCIGTTLLTKGLEFGTVAVLNAHSFRCPKHFYVAISRASRRLIIFSNSKTLRPYAEPKG